MFLQSNQKNFDKFAEDVVTDFLTQATPLSDAIVKLADTNMLKPEEVKRVVEKANTLATIRLIKTAQNGDLTFDLADPDKVLGRTHPEGTPGAPVVEPTPSTIQKEAMPNTLKTRADGYRYLDELRSQPKVAEANSHAPNLKEIFRLKHKGETLGRQKVAAELAFRKSVDSLLGDFNNLYGPDFSKFANEAHTIYGEDATPLLGAIAENVKAPTEFSKVAYVIDDVNNEQHKLFKVAQTAVMDVTRLTTEITETKAALADAWKAVREASTSTQS
jgi:hypothetical protein